MGSAVEAQERRLTLLPVLPPGASEPAVSFAGDLRRALSAPEGAFTLAATPLDADVLVEIRGAGPAGYRPGTEPGTRVHFGCRVLAKVTSGGALPTEIELSDVTCPDAADGLLRGIERLWRNPTDDDSERP